KGISLAQSLEYLGPVPVLQALLAAAVFALYESETAVGLLNEAKSLVNDGLKMVEYSREGMATSLLHGVASALALSEGDVVRAMAEARKAYVVARQAGNALIMMWSLPRLLDA